MVEHVRLSAYRFKFRTKNELCLPPVNKGNTLRGAFGFAFKRLVCTMPARCHPRCEQPQTCPYGQIFEPAPPPGSGRLSANSDIPRPFVFRPPLTTRRFFQKGSQIEFGLVLFGRVIEQFPYFAVTLKAVGDEGLGRKRTPLELISVMTTDLSGLGIPVYDSQNGRFQNSSCSFGIAELRDSVPSNGRLTLEFISPTVLKVDGKIVEQPAFHHILKRLRDRLNSIAAFYCGRPLDLDFRELGERAEAVETAKAHTRWVSRTRLSWKTGYRHQMGGFVGRLTFEGDFEPFADLLALGQYTHVGKYSVWGHGRYRIIKEES